MQALLLILAASNPTLIDARTHLVNGELTEVATAFDALDFPAEDKPEAARILAHAGRTALAQNDLILAYDCVSKALAFSPDEPLALEPAARIAMERGELDEAEHHIDALARLQPRRNVAWQLRAELATRRGTWSKTRDLGPVAVELPPVPPPPETLPQHYAEALSPQAIVYCQGPSPACEEACALLAEKGIEYVKRDVRADEDAAAEINRRLHHVRRAPEWPITQLKAYLYFGVEQLRSRLDSPRGRRSMW